MTVVSTESSPVSEIYSITAAFERRIARALAVAEKARVIRAAAIEPCGGSVYMHLVEIVVPVPFKKFRRVAEFGAERVNHARNRARKDGAGIRHAVAHRIAHAHLGRGFSPRRKDGGAPRRAVGQKTVNIRAGDILKNDSGE